MRLQINDKEHVIEGVDESTPLLWVLRDHLGMTGSKFGCGKALCGRVVDGSRLRANPDLRDVRNSDAKLRQRKLKGLVVLNGFTGGPREWKGGPVYDPETGDGAPRGQLKLLANGKLELKGCVAFFCRTKVWSRAS